MVMCLVCTIGCGIAESIYLDKFQIYLPWEHFVPGNSLGEKPGTAEEGAAVTAVLVFFSYIIILNTVVPISLYVR